MPILNSASRFAVSTRRELLAKLLGVTALSCAAKAAGEVASVRLAISETMVSDVNMNDARAAMLIWIKRMSAELNVRVEINPKVFDTTEEILRRVRRNELDAIALNVIEYRQIAQLLDSTQIISEDDASGPEEYLLLAKRASGIKRLGDLRARRICTLKAPKMCVAPAWLATILDEGHCGPVDQFFASMTTETKVSRVVLPVFFGQADACLTSKRGFDTMCELNPQVAKDLTAIASSPPMVVDFYIFNKNYRGVSRERFARVYSDLPRSVSGRQLATMFQFESLAVKNISCLAPALAVIEAAERIHARPGAGPRKG